MIFTTYKNVDNDIVYIVDAAKNRIGEEYNTHHIDKLNAICRILNEMPVDIYKLFDIHKFIGVMFKILENFDDSDIFPIIIRKFADMFNNKDNRTGIMEVKFCDENISAPLQDALNSKYYLGVDLNSIIIEELDSLRFKPSRFDYRFTIDQNKFISKFNKTSFKLSSDLFMCIDNKWITKNDIINILMLDPSKLEHMIMDMYFNASFKAKGVLEQYITTFDLIFYMYIKLEPVLSKVDFKLATAEQIEWVRNLMVTDIKDLLNLSIKEILSNMNEAFMAYETTYNK